MPESFADGFDAPIIETIQGKPISFPVLELDDLAALSRELSAFQKQRALERLSKMATPVERERIIAHFDNLPADIQSLSGAVFDIHACAKFLNRSLMRGGMADAKERQGLIDRYRREQGLRKVSDLAARVSGLFEPVKPEKTSPNAGAGQTDPANNGDNGESSSNESADSPPAA